MRLETNGPLDRMRMRDVLHIIFEITDDVMLDLAFKAFDRDNNNYVDDVEFIRGLSIMLRGSTEELCDWCYYIYDMNGDGGLAREELSYCLKGCLVPGFGIEADEAEDSENDIVEIVMRKLDVDRDGQISHADFKSAVRRDPLMLVSVGPCLPPSRCCAAFLSLITEKFRSYTGPLGRHPFKKSRKSQANVSLMQSYSSFRRPSRPTKSFNFGISSTMPSTISMIGSSVRPSIQEDTLAMQAKELEKERALESDIKKAKTLSISMVGSLPTKTLDQLRHIHSSRV